LAAALSSIGPGGKKKCYVSPMSQPLSRPTCVRNFVCQCSSSRLKPVDFNSDIWWFPQIGVPQIDGFFIGHVFLMDDLETPISAKLPKRDR